MTGPDHAPRFSRGMSLGLAAVVLLAAVAILGVFFLDLDEGVWVQQIEDEILSWGPFGVLASIWKRDPLAMILTFLTAPAATRAFSIFSCIVFPREKVGLLRDRNPG